MSYIKEKQKTNNTKNKEQKSQTHRAAMRIKIREAMKGSVLYKP